MKIEPAALLAICAVESGGRAFAEIGGRKEPLIRFEGHYFDRLLPDAARQKARSMGLANPKAGAVKNPRWQADRWALLRRARSIDDDVALQSVSWGIGQVMGAHWRVLGYSSPQALVRQARSGVGGQVRLMVKFIQTNGLLVYLQRHDWAGFAYRYNGPAFRRNRYDAKMAQAYARYASQASASKRSAALATLRRGARGAAVRDLQQSLLAAGYPLTVDGVFGPKTEDAVKRFQRANGLVVDGVYGPQTDRALSGQLAEQGKGSRWIARLILQLSRFVPLMRVAARLRRWTR